LPEQGETKGEREKKTIIAELCRDAEDAELRKRKVARTADTSGHWRIASAFGFERWMWAKRGHGWLQKLKCDDRKWISENRKWARGRCRHYELK
jgi:hypothetical protein